MRWIFNFIALLFLAGTAQAQEDTGTLDSLEKLSTTSQKPGDKARRADLLLAIGEAHSNDHDFQKVLQSFQEAHSVAGAVGDNKLLAETLLQTGKTQRKAADYEAAIETLEKIKPLASSGTELFLAEAYHELSKSFQLLGNNELAYEYALASLPIWEANSDATGTMRCKYQIGGILFFQEDFDLALDYYQQTRNLAESLHDSIYIYNSLAAIGGAYSRKGAAEASMQYNLRAYALAKSLGYETGLGYSAQNVGINHLALSRFDSALFYFKASYEMQKKTKDRWGEVASLQYIGKTCLEMGDSNSGLVYLRQALALAKEIQAKPRVLEIYQLLAEAYQKLEEPALAYQYLKSYTVLKDSLVNENMQQKMANAQTTYHLQQREEALTQKTQEIRTIYVISIIGAFFALAVLLWLAYSKMSQQYALNDELKQKNLLIAKQNQQMEVLLDGQKVKRKNAVEAERIQIKSNPLKRAAFITK